jgi:4,5-DOPA dioxygenase extradiol
MLYLAGLAAASDRKTESLVQGYAYGSLSMASYVLGASARPGQERADSDAPALPDLDPEQTNL